MRQILVYGDSLTWGIIPNARERLPFPSRWPGIVEAELVKAGKNVRLRYASARFSIVRNFRLKPEITRAWRPAIGYDRLLATGHWLATTS